MKKTLFGGLQKRVSLLVSFLMMLSVLPVNVSMAKTILDEDSVTAILQTTPQFMGLTANMGGDGGNHDCATMLKDGREGWLMKPKEDLFFIYGNINNDFIYGDHNKVEITVAYYDAGSGAFRLQYDATDNDYKDGELVALGDSNTWKEHTFVVEDADFKDGFMGQDIRLASYMSGADVLISSITVKKIIDEPTLNYVYAVLQTTPQCVGLSTAIGGDDGNHEAVIDIKQDKEGWLLQPENQRFYLYGNVDNRFIYGGSNKVQVDVTYYDEGDGKFTLLYDGVKSNDEQSDVVYLQGTNGWKTYSFVLEDAEFADGLLGQDIRVGAFIPYDGFSKTDILISKVQVSKIKEVEESYRERQLNDFESEDDGWEGKSHGAKTGFERTLKEAHTGMYSGVLSGIILEEKGYSQVEKNLRFGNLNQINLWLKSSNLKNIKAIIKDASGNVIEKNITLDQDNLWHKVTIENIKNDIARLPVMGIGFKVTKDDLIDPMNEFEAYMDDITIFLPDNIRDSAQVQLGKDVIKDGINCWSGDNASGLQIPTDKGKDCWMTNKAQNNLFCYFDIEDAYIFNEACDVEVDVDYLDQGNGRFTLQYNAAQGAEVVTLTDTGEWKTHTFKLNKVLLNNGLNGADFRIGLWAPWMPESETDICFSKVIVRKASDQQIKIESQSNKAGNIFTQNEPLEIDAKFTSTVAQKQNLGITYSIKDYENRCLKEESFNCEIMPFASKIYPLDLASVEGFGTYTIDMTMTSGSGVVNKIIPFSKVLAPKSISRASKISTCTHFAQSKGDAEINTKIAAQAGIGFIRDEMYWADAEREKGQIKILPSWDKWVDETLKNGIEPLLILSYGNQFYDGGKAPQSEEAIEAYANYARTLAEYFKGKVNYFQIWNEWNGGLGNPSKLPPEDYAKLLIRASKAIKEVNPKAIIIGGATSGADITWIERTFKAGAFDSMDIISMHPYCYPTGPENGGVAKSVENLNKMIKKYGTNKKVWITEIGWPTHMEEKGGVSEIVSAAYAIRMYTWAMSTDSLDNVFWYDLQNDGVSKDLNEDNFGLVRCWVDSEAVPAAAKLNYVAISAFASQMNDAKFVRQYKFAENVEAYQFYRPTNQKDIMVLWSTKNAKTFGLDIASGDISMMDILGNTKIVTPKDEKINVTVTAKPTYLIGNFKKNIQVAEADFKLENTSLYVTQGETVSIQVNKSEEAKEKVGTYKLVLPQGWELIGSTDFNKGNSQDILKIHVPSDAIKKAYEISLVPMANNEALTNLTVAVNVVDAFSMKARPYSIKSDDWKQWGAKVTITNHTSTKPLKGNMKLQKPEEWSKLNDKKAFNIMPLGKEEIILELPNLLGQDLYTLEFDVNFEDNSHQTFKQKISYLGALENKEDIVLDGQIDQKEWEDSMMFTLNNQAEYEKLGDANWGGVDDLSAKGYIKWDTKYFYLAADVKDDQHSQKGTGSDIWGGDCIQFSIDPDRENAIGNKGWNEIGIALNSKDGKLYSWQWNGAEGLATGEITNIDGNVIRNKDHTGYEIAVPWRNLLPKGIEPYDGLNLGFSFLINDEDSVGRKGFLHYMEGIGLEKNPNLFGDLVLVAKPDTEPTPEPTPKPTPEPTPMVTSNSGGKSIGAVMTVLESVQETIKQLSPVDKQSIITNLKEKMSYTYLNSILTMTELKALTKDKFTDKQLKAILENPEVLRKLDIDIPSYSKHIILRPKKYKGFKDVSENHWAKQAIKHATELGIVAGMTDDMFGVNRPITLEDSCTFLDRILLFNNKTESSLPRSVVERYITNQSQWAYWHMASIASKLSEGTLDKLTTIEDKVITRELFAQMLYEITQGKLEKAKASVVFKDTLVSPYKEAIDYCVATGLLNGTGKDEMSPTKELTRAELMTILIRLDQLLK